MKIMKDFKVNSLILILLSTITLSSCGLNIIPEPEVPASQIVTGKCKTIKIKEFIELQEEEEIVLNSFNTETEDTLSCSYTFVSEGTNFPLITLKRDISKVDDYLYASEIKEINNTIQIDRKLTIEKKEKREKEQKEVAFFQPYCEKGSKSYIKDSEKNPATQIDCKTKICIVSVIKEDESKYSCNLAVKSKKESDCTSYKEDSLFLMNAVIVIPHPRRTCITTNTVNYRFPLPKDTPSFKE